MPSQDQNKIKGVGFLQALTINPLASLYKLTIALAPAMAGSPFASPPISFERLLNQ